MNEKNLPGPKGLVNTSASMYVVRTYETVTICLSTNSRTKKSAISTCFVAEDKTGFAETATTPIESENRLTACLVNKSTRPPQPISAERSHVEWLGPYSIRIHQRPFVEQVLLKSGFNGKPGDVPMSLSIKLTKADCQTREAGDEEHRWYRSTLMSLNHAANWTRPT